MFDCDISLFILNMWITIISYFNEVRTMVDIQNTKWKYRRNRRIRI